MPKTFKYDYDDKDLQPPNAATQVGWAGVPLNDTLGYAGVTKRATVPTNDLLGHDPDYASASPGLIAEHWLERFNKAITSGSVPEVLNLIYQDGWWRDVGFLTWDIRSLRGSKEIGTLLSERLVDAKISNVRLIAGVPPVLETMGDDLVLVAIHYEFDCGIGTGSGFARLCASLAKEGQPLVPECWQAWTVSTTLDSLRDVPEKVGGNVDVTSKLCDPLGKARTYQQQLEDEQECVYEEPVVVIVGAGHVGLTQAARLGTLGVKTLVIEKNSKVISHSAQDMRIIANPDILTKPGSSWSNRYASLSLHNPTACNHLPYLPFPPTFPMYIPAQRLGKYLETYASAMDLNVWCDSTLEAGASYDESTRKWRAEYIQSDYIHRLTHSRDRTISVKRPGGIRRVLHPSYLIIATGITGSTPAVPTLPGLDKYKGEVCHSSTFRIGDNWSGKKCLIIGAATSAHDIAWELHENKCEVTVLQRSSTMIMSVDKGVPLAYGNYVAGKSSIEECDRESWLATPFPVAYELAPRLFSAIKQVDQDILAGLKKVGFQLNDGLHGTGALGLTNYTIGTSTLLAEKKINLVHGEVAKYDTNGVVFKDGSTQKADVVIWANGFFDTKGPVRAVLGDEMADKVREKVEKGNGFMIDPEGEARMQHRELAQPGLYQIFQQFAFTRFHSKRLALKIAAREAGIPVEVYGHRQPEPTSFAEGLLPRSS